MHHASDLSFSGSIADHAGEQNATQSIAERMTVATFKGFKRDYSEIGIVLINRRFNIGRLQQSGVGHSWTVLFNTLGSLHR